MLGSASSRSINVKSRYDRRSLKFCFVNYELDAPNNEVLFYLKDGKLQRICYGKESDGMQVGNAVRQLILQILKEVQAIDNDPNYGGVQVSRTYLSVNLACDVSDKIARKIADIITNKLFEADIYVNIPKFVDEFEDKSLDDIPRVSMR